MPTNVISPSISTNVADTKSDSSRTVGEDSVYLETKEQEVQKEKDVKENDDQTKEEESKVNDDSKKQDEDKETDANKDQEDDQKKDEKEPEKEPEMPVVARQPIIRNLLEEESPLPSPVASPINKKAPVTPSLSSSPPPPAESTPVKDAQPPHLRNKWVTMKQAKSEDASKPQFIPGSPILHTKFHRSRTSQIWITELAVRQ